MAIGLPFSNKASVPRKNGANAAARSRPFSDSPLPSSGFSGVPDNDHLCRLCKGVCAAREDDCEAVLTKRRIETSKDETPSGAGPERMIVD